MTNIVDAKEALANWLDKDVIVKIPGEGSRVAVGVMANRILNNLTTIAPKLEQNLFIAASGLIRDGKVDESVLVELREGLKGGTLKIPIPILGTISLDGEALDSLYQMLVSTRS